MTRLYYFTDLPGLAVSTQLEMAAKHGHTAADPSWTDSAKSFPVQRERMFTALRAGRQDEIWVASLPILAANRSDMRHVVDVLWKAEAALFEGATGWTSWAPHESGLMFANCWDWWGKRRKLLDEPRGNGKATRNGAKNRRMPDAEANTIWFDKSIISNAAAIKKMNADPRYRKPWTYSTACHRLGKSSRPPGARPKPRQPETNE